MIKYRYQFHEIVSDDQLKKYLMIILQINDKTFGELDNFQQISIQQIKQTTEQANKNKNITQNQQKMNPGQEQNQFIKNQGPQINPQVESNGHMKQTQNIKAVNENNNHNVNQNQNFAMQYSIKILGARGLDEQSQEHVGQLEANIDAENGDTGGNPEDEEKQLNQGSQAGQQNGNQGQEQQQLDNNQGQNQFEEQKQQNKPDKYQNSVVDQQNNKGQQNQFNTLENNQQNIVNNNQQEINFNLADNHNMQSIQEGEPVNMDENVNKNNSHNMNNKQRKMQKYAIRSGQQGKIIVKQEKDNDQQEPFKWGEEEEEQGISREEDRKNDIKNFMANSQLSKSYQMMKEVSNLSKMIIKAKQQQKLNKNLAKSIEISKKNDRNKKQHTKLNQLKHDDMDIWDGIKKQMMQRSRVSQQLKSSKASELKNISIIKNNSIKQINYSSQKLLRNNQSQILPQNSSKKLLKIGRSQNSDAISNIESMGKVISQKMKNWRKQQKQIQMRRNQKINNEMQRLKKQQQMLLEEQRKKKLQEKKQRVKIISQKLQKKKKRKLNLSKQKSIEKDKLVNNKYGKVRKSKTEKNYQNSKNLKKDSSSQKLPNLKQKQEDFSIFWNRNKQVYSQQKQKLLRRKLFEQKIKQIPVNINEDKKVKMQMDIDKNSNPLKYQLLRNKGLSDAQIFKSNQQIKIPQNSKVLGKEYLKQLRQKNKSDDLRRFMSQQSILNIPKIERSWKSPVLQVQQKRNQQIIYKAPRAQSKSPNIYQQKARKVFQQDDQYLNALKR